MKYNFDWTVMIYANNNLRKEESRRKHEKHGEYQLRVYNNNNNIRFLRVHPTISHVRYFGNNLVSKTFPPVLRALPYERAEVRLLKDINIYIYIYSYIRMGACTRKEEARGENVGFFFILFFIDFTT